MLQQDTVIDAGLFDGSLGIICAISALKALKASGRLGNLRRPVEVRHIDIKQTLPCNMIVYHIFCSFIPCCNHKIENELEQSGFYSLIAIFFFLMKPLNAVFRSYRLYLKGYCTLFVSS